MSASATSTRSRRGIALATITALLAGVFVATASTTAASAVDGGTVSGTVYGTGGVPLAGARVSLDYSISPQSGETVAQATTDANGHYTMTAFYPGYFYLSVSGPEGSPYLYESWADNDAFGDAYLIGLPTGRVLTGRDVTLSVGATVTGNVKLGSANLAGVTVRDISSEGYTTGATATTDASGNYTLAGLRPGSHTVLFDAAGTTAADEYYNDAILVSQADYFTVTTGTTTGINAVLAAGATYSGNIKRSGTPNVNLSSAYIELFDSEQRSVGYQWTEDDGNFSIANLAAGTYSVRVRDFSGYRNVEQNTTVTLTAGQNSSGHNFVLTSGAFISGVVTGTGGAPLVNAQVGLYDTTTGYYVTGDNADSTGFYEISGVAPGTYKLSFALTGYQTQWWNNAASMATATTITVVGTNSYGDHDAALGLGATVSGTVTSGNPSIPLDDARVVLRDTAGLSIAYAEVQSNGTYSIGGVPAGSYVLEFRGNGGLLLPEYSGGGHSLAGATYFSVAANATVTGKNATLDPLATVSGHVQNSSATSLSGVSAQLYNSAGSFVDDAVTDASGNYTIPFVAAGTYTLKFNGNGASALPAEWWDDATSAGTATTFTVGLGEQVTGKSATLGVAADDATISGTVLKRDGGGVSGVTVVAYSSTGGENLASVKGSAVTDGSGAFTITGLAAGSYKLGASTAAGGYNATSGALLASTGGYVSIWSGGVYSFATASATTVAAHGSATASPVTIENPVFSDVSDPTSTVYTYIEWMYYQNISTGTPVSGAKPLYKPADSVSRQAMASFLYRLSGDTFIPPTTATFADVAVGSQFFTAIEWMSSKGISTGTPQTGGLPLYKPSDAVSRQAMATFLARYKQVPNLSVAPTTQSFADVPVSAGPAAAIKWMKDAGISVGTAQPSGLPLYKPSDPVSRSAMAAFLYRVAALSEIG